MTTENNGKKPVGLRIRLTPEEYDFAEFYGKEFSHGGARDYLRVLLMQALAREMQEEREIKARLREEEPGGPRSPETSSFPDLDDALPF